MQGRKICHFLAFLFLFCMAFGRVSAQSIDSLVLMDSSAVRADDSLAVDSISADSAAVVWIEEMSLYDDLKVYFLLKDKDPNSWLTWINTKRQLAPDEIKDEMKHSRPVWVLVLSIGLCLGVGLIRVFFTSVFHNIILAYYDERVLHQVSKEDNLLTSWSYIFLYILFSLSLGLFILIYQSKFSYTTELIFINFLKISGIVALLFALKIFAVRLIAIIFEMRRLLREYITILYLVYFNSMIILLPLLLIVTFVPAANFNFMLIFFCIVVSLLFLYRFVRTTWTTLNNLRFSIFYLIIYLCTLEIAPILILVKTLNS